MKRIASLTALLLALSACLPIFESRSPLLPSLGVAEARKATFAAEFAKHPEAPGCSTFKEVYVSTDGKKAIWTLECSDGLLVEFFVNEKGVVEGSQAVGSTKR